MEKINAETYGKLYAAHLNDMPPSRFLWGIDLKDKVAWDLCCGTGVVALDMVARGAKGVLAIEPCYEMAVPFMEMSKAKRLDAIKVCFESVELFLNHEPIFFAPDVVVCRGKAGTWLNEKTAERLAKLMKHGSIFVFDGPVRKPMHKPKVMEYEHDGKWFAELDWAVGNGVCHIQAREGMEAHVTWARTLFSNDVEKFLGKWFDVSVSRDAGVALYDCRRTSS